MAERLIEPDPEDVNDVMPAPASEAGAGQATEQGAEQATGAAPEAAPEAGAEQGAGAIPEAGAEPEAEGAPDLARFLQSDEGRASIDSLIDEILADEAEKLTVEAKEQAKQEEQKKIAATLAEAYREGVNSGDWSQYGELRAKIDARAALMHQVASTLQPEIESRAVRMALDAIDTAVESAFGDALAKLTPDELVALQRQNFGSDAEFYSAVMTAIRGKLENSIRGEVKATKDIAEAAIAAARTAQKTRTDGLGVLPAGTGEPISRISSIGDLIRMGLGSSGEREDDSD